MRSDELRTGLKSGAPGAEMPYSVSIPMTLGRATWAGYYANPRRSPSVSEPREQPGAAFLERGDGLPSLRQRSFERGNVLVRHAGLLAIEALVHGGVPSGVIGEVAMHRQLALDQMLLVPQAFEL